MRKSLSYAGIAAAALFVAGCGDLLAVKNTNAPSVEASFSTAKGVELLIGGLGPQLNNAQRATESVNTQSKVLSGESFASVANFGMAARAQIPRSIISNELGNDNGVGNLANFSAFQRYARNAAEAIRRLDLLKAAGDSLTTGNELRAKAHAYFILGQSLGYLSMMYDSAAIITPTTAPVSPEPGAPQEPLSGYQAVNAAAIEMLDSAFAFANRTVGTTTMAAIPATWLSQNGTTSAANFRRLIRSYRARIRAGVARNAAARQDSVDWTAVIADATNGITADYAVNIGGTTGWSAQFDAGQAYVVGGWHSVPMLYLGMADTTNAYELWLQEDINFRRQFLLRTPDRRWASGNTRGAQQANVAGTPGTTAFNSTGNPLLPFQCNGDPAGTTNCARYIRNRSAQDVPIVGWGESQYDHRRYAATVAAGQGTYVDMARAEVDLLAAEGYIRTGAPASAEPLIDRTRVRNYLSSVVGVGAGGTVPLNPGGGATNCVPRVPQPPSYTSTACGSLLEALKYEKRMETMMTGYGISFTDNRGWGDLVTGTVIEWPVPYQELQARGKTIYNGTRRFGTPGTTVNTYGF